MERTRLGWKDEIDRSTGSGWRLWSAHVIGKPSDKMRDSFSLDNTHCFDEEEPLLLDKAGLWVGSGAGRAEEETHLRHRNSNCDQVVVS
ncbi:unnamed protein product [Pleuronectes platessa]|uniref:Uncharacterized protein n=1 Tax=Pleuronectes platessa TaxID=8262 RepID=A0A9N7Z8B2_PLEPL|nr:unnamed protein product [Pleuronectes platessa]